MSKQYKVYRETNYIRVIDTTTNELFNGTVKDVFVDKSNTQKNIYRLFNVKDLAEGTVFSIPDILKANGSAYSVSEWEAFYTENTGNFNGGGTAPTNLSYLSSPTQGTIVSDTGTDATIPLADVTNAGLLSPADKANLDNQSGVNSGDETSIVGISGTKSQFNTELTDGDFLFEGDITQYTDELAQDAVGNILTDSTTIDFTYNDTTPSISADVKLNSIDATHLANNINVSKFTNDSGYITLADVDGTDLTYSLSLTDGTIISSTGSDAIIPLASIVNAGLISPQEKQNIASAIQLEDLANVATSGNYEDLNNIPTTFNPTPHTHPISDIVNLQTNLDLKQDNLVSGTTIKTIEGQSILGSGNIDITKSDVGLPLADNTSDDSKSVLSSTKLTTPRYINGVNFDGTSNITINAVDSTPRIAVSEKAQANGVATLGSDGKVPNNQIPALAISETFPVSSQDQMLALSQAYQGDVAIRSDISKSFILRVLPSSVLANWNELLTPTSAVTSVNGQVGVVTLSKSDVGLSNVDNTSDANKPISTAQQTALNLKENSANKQNSLAADGTNTFYPTVTAVNAGLALKSNDNAVVHLAGTETITGVKTFNDISAVTNYKSSTNNVIISDNAGVVFRGVRANAWSDNLNARFFQIGDINDNVIFTTKSGNKANRMLFSSLKTQISSGIFAGIAPLGIFEVTNGTSRFFNVFESGNSVFGGGTDDSTNKIQVAGTVSSGTTTAGNTPPTANNQLTRKDYVDTGLGTKENSFTKNTAFNKNFGTTAGTVVEGGTLGSNAYTSTAYLPLAGGTVDGPVYLNSTTGGLISFQTNSLPSALMTSSQNILGTGSTTDFNAYVYGNNPYNIWTNGVKRLEISGLGEFKINNLSGTGTRNVVADASGNLLTDSTVYAPLNGTGANGTWGINISGNSQTSSALGSYNWNPTVKDNADFIFGRNSANEIAIISQLGARNFLGLGSNAYSSTAFLPLTGGTLSGNLNVKSILKVGDDSYNSTIDQAGIGKITSEFTGGTSHTKFYGHTGTAANYLILSIDGLGNSTFTGTMKMKEYTVATLPTPTGTAYATVTDALAPTYMATVVGGGAVVTPVFYNGTVWVSH